MNKKLLPVKIEPCPIAEAIVEIRFTPNKRISEIFALFYASFHERYQTLEELPALQVPELIREQDPNLRYVPYYRLVDDNFLIQIGSHTLSIINRNQYAGWDTFKERIREFFKRSFEFKIFSSIDRASIRYVDFFSGLNIFEKINLNINYQLDDVSSPLPQGKIVFHNEFEWDEYTQVVKIANNARYSSDMGSCIDLDLIFDCTKSNFDLNDLHSLMDKLEKGHDIQKNFFFNLLQDSFLSNLNPQYE